MSDDWNNCVMVILLFILLFVYYTYLKTIIRLKRDWANYKCNPIYMLVSSLKNPTDNKHSDNFQTCVKKVFEDTYSPSDVEINLAQSWINPLTLLDIPESTLPDLPDAST